MKELKQLNMIHECGRRVQVIDDGVAPHFILDELHMDMCPRCYRNLINDWMDEPWRFWTLAAWQKLNLWEEAVRDVQEKQL